jgi:hypothetical protein
MGTMGRGGRREEKSGSYIIDSLPKNEILAKKKKA